MVIFACELRKQSKSKNDILKLQFQCQKIKRSAISDSHCLVTNNTNLKDLTAIFKKTSIIFIVFLQIFAKSDFTMITLSSHLEPAFWAHLPLVKHLSLNNSVITTNFITSEFKMSLMRPWKIL